MKSNSNSRKELKKKMGKALRDKIKPLPTELQDILLDDLITAFESRLAVLTPEQSNLHWFVDERLKVSIESIQT